LFVAPAAAMVPTSELPSRSEWLAAMHESRDENLSFKVMRARTLFDHVAWRADARAGHWKNPAELLKQGSGNLLELVAAYYFTLRGMGIDANDIRLYVGKMNTLDKIVPHTLLAIRNHGPTYYIDPLRDTPMFDEAPAHFRPIMALNESGTWRTEELTDASVWETRGNNATPVKGWVKVCNDTLAMLGLWRARDSEAAPMALSGLQPRRGAGGKPKRR
jgi:hypothetical protein